MDPDSGPTALFSEPPEHASTFNYSTETAGEATRVWLTGTRRQRCPSGKGLRVSPRPPQQHTFLLSPRLAAPSAFLGGRNAGHSTSRATPTPQASSGALGLASQAVLGSSPALVPKCGFLKET